MTFNKKWKTGILTIWIIGCTAAPTQIDIPNASRRQHEHELEQQLIEIRLMQNLVEEALVLRSKAMAFHQYHRLREKQFGLRTPLIAICPMRLSR